MRATLLVLLALTYARPALGQPTVHAPRIQLAAPDPGLWRTQRRARFMLAAGAGLAAGSAVYLAWPVPDGYCDGVRMRNNWPGPARVVGALGIGIALGGGGLLVGSSVRHRYLRASVGQKWTAVGIGVGAFALVHLLSGLVWGVNAARGGGCST